MKLEDLFASIDELSPEDWERLKAYLVRQEKVRNVTADLDAAVDEFWGDSSEEEMRLIFEAMTIKNKLFRSSK